MSVGIKIKEIRKRIGITQERLADLIGVSLMTVRRWEWGNTSPSASMLPKLAEALNTSVEYLMGLTDDAPPETPQISLPINNMEKENKTPEYLDLGYWGNVAENAERAARSNDNGKKALIAGMLDMAKKAITGAETATPTPSISAHNGENSSYSVNIMNAGKA